MSAPALIKQADIGRAMREAKKHGAKRVRITGSDGTAIDIILVEEHLGEADVTSVQPTPGPSPFSGDLAPNTQKVDF